MSEYARDKENANAALVVSVDSADFGSSPLDGIEFQRQLEQRAYHMGGGAYRAPAQSANYFLQGKPGFQCESAFALLSHKKVTKRLWPAASYGKIGIVGYRLFAGKGRVIL